MSTRDGRNAKALSLLIVWTLALGGLFAAIAALGPAAQAGVCDQVGGVITGDWTITTTQVCSGIVYTVDGTVNVNSGGSLTLVNGGLSFSKDTTHAGYALNVNAGGELVLDNSIVTTQTDAISPYLKLSLTVSGANSRFAMKNGAVLKFPGWFNATSATLNITDSKITGFTDSEIVGLGIDTNDNNDGPVISWSSTSASIYRSRIERLYEYTSAAQPLSLAGGTSLYSYDSYIGIDYSNQATIHNELRVDGTSNAYLYNITIDRSQDPISGQADWLPAFRPTAVGGTINLLRWLRATVVDSSGIPVDGATIWSTLSPSATTAEYPDNALGATPTSRTLWYLGRSAGGSNAWNRTDAEGLATIPLWTDQVTTATLPNAESFGNYYEAVAYSTSSTSGDVYFNAYPAVSSADNNKWLTMAFSGLQVCPSGVTTWSFTRNIVGPVSVAGCLEISGTITITNGELYVDQGSSGNSRSYVKILSGGSLTLVGSSVWSNFPLAFYVANGGTLVGRQGSSLLMAARGQAGLLREDGATSSVTITDSTINANVTLYGGIATLVRDTFLGPTLAIDTVQKSDLWDASLTGVTSLAILTDDGNANTVDVEIRNTTFNAAQTSQLVFGGLQNVQLTSVQTYDPDGTWWVGMITGGAKVSRYWWLSIDAVDGTGTLLADANVSLTLQRMDPVTLTPVAVANPAPGDIYYTADTTWPIDAPAGLILYRALAETRTVSTRTVDNSYIATGTAFLDGTTYFPDASAQDLVTADTVAYLVLSSLTPDLSVTSIGVSGGNGGSQLQPVNTDIYVTATIRNTGQINVRNLKVSFFEDNVDRPPSDGLMDFPPLAYIGSGLWINDTSIDIGKNTTATATVLWHPNGALESSRTVSAVVDPPLVAVDDGGAVRETNERNNILARTFTLFTWPDLEVSSADIQFASDPVVNNDVQMTVTVHNVGTNKATGAILEVFEGASRVAGPATFDLGPGGSTSLNVVWRPSSVGNHVLTFAVKTASGADIRNRDYVLGNNNASFTVNVLTQPDLELRQTDYAGIRNVTQNQGFTIDVLIYNVGQTTAVNVSVAAFFGSTQLGRVDGLTIGAFLNVSVPVTGIGVTGQQRVLLKVDPDNRINEGGIAQEANNYANVTVNVQPPAGFVVIQSPSAGQSFEPGTRIGVTGFVRDQGSNGIAGVTVTITLESGSGVLASNTTVSQDLGLFVGVITVPDVADGSYSLVVTPSSGLIPASSETITVKKSVPFLNQPVPILGLPYWLLFVILAAAVALAVGVTLYVKVFGLGKMVECGECGAFIPEDATTCPKCGVEFEKDMAKCSNCQAWIPVDVKQCPECGVEFATGEVEMADYQEKMRLQYDEVVAKFKEAASRQLGRSLSDREFQEWWRKQPTFLTFEDWLRDEEDMRKMGSKPCPACGTLNSVTATVCHKCGSLMRESARPPGGGGGAPAVPARKPVAAVPAPAQPPSEPQPSPYSAPGAAAPAPGTSPEVMPRRVIRRPVTPQPLIQKKVVKKAAGEGQEGGAEDKESQSSGEKSSDEDV